MIYILHRSHNSWHPLFKHTGNSLISLAHHQYFFGALCIPYLGSIHDLPELEALLERRPRQSGQNLGRPLELADDGVVSVASDVLPLPVAVVDAHAGLRAVGARPVGLPVGEGDGLVGPWGIKLRSYISRRIKGF